MAPSSTLHSLSSPFQPASVRPSNNGLKPSSAERRAATDEIESGATKKQKRASMGVTPAIVRGWRFGGKTYVAHNRNPNAAPSATYAGFQLGGGAPSPAGQLWL